MTTHRISLSNIILAVLLATAMLPVSYAQVSRYVDPDGSDYFNDCHNISTPCSSVAHAIDQSSDGDHIMLAAGTYAENELILQKSLTITGSGSEDSVVEAAGVHRVLTILAGFAVTLQDFTLTGGLSPGGGGIQNSGTLTLARMIVTGNSTPNDNERHRGGGIYNADGATLEVNHSVVTRNSAPYPDAGGNIYSGYDAVLVIHESEISYNTGPMASSAGGILNFGHLSVSFSSILGHSSVHSAAGIDGGGSLAIESSVIAGNFSLEGISGVFGNGTIRNSTFSNNYSHARIGSGYTVGGSLYISHSTFAHNYTSGNPSKSAAISGSLHLKNTLLADNPRFECSGTIYSHGYNIFENLPTDDSNVSCEVIEVENAGTDIIGEDPLVGEAEPFAEPVHEIHPIHFGSVAQDAGSCTDIHGEPVEYDQRGMPRFDGLCDIGAFELDPYVDLASEVEALGVSNAAAISARVLHARELHLSAEYESAAERLRQIRDRILELEGDNEITSEEAAGLLARVDSLLAKIDLQLANRYSCEGLYLDDITLTLGQFDSDQGSEDLGEYVDVVNTGDSDISLTGCAIVFYDGFTSTSYFSADLAGIAGQNPPFRIGNPGVPNTVQHFPANTLQDGPDAIALYEGTASSFPHGTLVTTDGLLSAIVYVNDDIIFGANKSSGYATLQEALKSVAGETYGGTPSVPSTFVLDQNRPNPFNPTTTIRFGLPTASMVRITIYDALGREVSRLHQGELSSGWHDVTWAGSDRAGRRMPSGLYFYRLESDNTSLSRSMILMK